MFSWLQCAWMEFSSEQQQFKSNLSKQVNKICQHNLVNKCFKTNYLFQDKKIKIQNVITHI